MLQTTCQGCGKVFETFPSQPRKYCSVACKNLNKSAEVTCKNCGKVSRVPKCLSSRPFCSVDCQRSYEHLNGKEKARGRRSGYTTKVCKTCGIEFEILSSKADRRNHCSVSCRAKDPEVMALMRPANSKTVLCAYCGSEITRCVSRCRKLAFCSMEHLGKYQAESEEYGEKLLKYRRDAGNLPNKLEKHIAEIFPSLTYVGDGKLWIAIGNGKRKCPDFILSGSNKLIEIWGDYWHKGQSREDAKGVFEQAGYECLIVMGSEIRKDKEATMKRMNNFLKGTN
jgi:very-short-patch-repair endonuclease